MEHKLDLIALLEYIDPSFLSYQEWVNVGMALKYEGYTASDWDDGADGTAAPPGECFKKWTSFEGSGNPVTGATITQLAKDNGWVVGRSESLDGMTRYPAAITSSLIRNGLKARGSRTRGLESYPAITTYLETLFEASENVGYVTDTWQNDEGKYLPTKGAWDRTAGELIQD